MVDAVLHYSIPFMRAVGRMIMRIHWKIGDHWIQVSVIEFFYCCQILVSGGPVLWLREMSDNDNHKKERGEDEGFSHASGVAVETADDSVDQVTSVIDDLISVWLCN